MNSRCSFLLAACISFRFYFLISSIWLSLLRAGYCKLQCSIIPQYYYLRIAVVILKIWITFPASCLYERYIIDPIDALNCATWWGKVVQTCWTNTWRTWGICFFYVHRKSCVAYPFVWLHSNLRLQVQTKPKVPTQAVCAEHLELRKEVLTMLNLKKQVLLVFQGLRQKCIRLRWSSVLLVSDSNVCYLQFLACV